EGTLSEIQRACAASQNDAGHARALGFRSKNEEYCRAQNYDCGENAASEARPVDASKAIAEEAAESAADRHREKRKHGVEGAGLQVQAAHLNQIDIKPTEENPGDISKAKITQGYGKHFFAGKHVFPGDELWMIFGRSFCRQT